MYVVLVVHCLWLCVHVVVQNSSCPLRVHRCPCAFMPICVYMRLMSVIEGKSLEVEQPQSCNTQAERPRHLHGTYLRPVAGSPTVALRTCTTHRCTPQAQTPLHTALHSARSRWTTAAAART